MSRDDGDLGDSLCAIGHSAPLGTDSSSFSSVFLVLTQIFGTLMQNDISAIILEDTPADIRTAARVLNQAGIENPLIFNNLPRAMMYLEDVVAGEKPCPHLIVLDLGLGLDSGFEALRFRKSNVNLLATKVVVWTVQGDQHEEMCKLLGANQVVAKDAGEKALLNAVVAVAAS